MSKTFFEIFNKYNPMNLVSKGFKDRSDHYHRYVITQHGEDSKCQEPGCEAIMTTDDYEDFFTQPIPVVHPLVEAGFDDCGCGGYVKGLRDGYNHGNLYSTNPELAEAWSHDGALSQREWMIDQIKTQLLWPQLDDGFRGGLEWMLRQLESQDPDGI